MDRLFMRFFFLFLRVTIMDSHALEYYSPYTNDNPHGHFHQVIALHDERDLDWVEASTISPELPKGWYELSRLSNQDRLDFVHEFWIAKLPYHPNLKNSLFKFFASLDDIGIFLTQARNDDPFEPQMIYSLAEDSGFFHGEPYASEEQIITLQKEFVDYILPGDYLSFLQIHNGFAKLTDTGILKSNGLKENYLAFQQMLELEYPMLKSDGTAVNPRTLIPFYKSFGMPFFQCFWGEWYPENEMGNVYFSGVTKTISDCTKADCRVETMAFETFTDWLTFYLEKID